MPNCAPVRGGAQSHKTRFRSRTTPSRLPDRSKTLLHVLSISCSDITLSDEEVRKIARVAA
jgi:hypothetical protein